MTGVLEGPSRSHMAREERLPYPRASGPGWSMLHAVEAELRETEFTERPRDDLTGILRAALLEASGDERWHATSTHCMAELLIEHDGIAWLLPGPNPSEPVTDLGHALHLVTARYATG